MLRYSTLFLAKKFNRTHKGIIKLINIYIETFKLFGPVIFKTQKERGTSGKPTIFVFLNAQQVGFLITMIRIKNNKNDEVLNIKKSFIEKSNFDIEKIIEGD